MLETPQKKPSPAEFVDDPEWAAFLPEVRDAAKKRHLPTHDDCSRIDPAALAEHLMRGGVLGSMPDYEERPGQIDMLKAVARAFNSRGHLMIEAGTGVGKSLAYLIPAMHWALVNDTPVLVSTATRNLQGQLVGSDIPKALATLGEGAKDFRVALLKGRANYLCLRAVSEFFSSGYWTMTPEEQAEMPRFIAWLKSTSDGDLDTYDGLPRSLVSCVGDECAGRRCPYHSRCFVHRARKAAAEAHLVVVNHSLVVADAANPGAGVLPAYGRLVIDEAHNLENVATEYLRDEFSVPALARILNRLRRQGRRGRGGQASGGGVLSSVERQLRRGVLSSSPVADRVSSLLAQVPSKFVRIMDSADGLSDAVSRLLVPSGGDGPVRYRTVRGELGGVERQHSLHGLFKPYGADEWDEERFLAAQAEFETELAGLVNLLHEMRDALEQSAPEGEFNYCGDLAAQIEGLAATLVEFANDANFALKGEKDTHAYWVERIREGKRPAYIRAVGAPLSVADALKALLYDTKDSVVLSSATLRVGDSFKYMASRLGCSERFTALTAPSPFDYLRQSMVFAADCLPDPTANPKGYSASLAAMLRELFTTTRGRALVLFTSHEMMRSVAENARADLADAGIRLIVQGEGMSRESMTRELKSGSGVVLFGAQSFWEGVDVSGEALSCVVLARLPFPQVGDPMVEARSEKIEREGGSAFRDYSLPEAVIRFRQGFGRLIRSKRDRGVVVVTDPRVVTKNYGATFRKSIPASVRTVADVAQLTDMVAEFFGDSP